MAETSLGKVTSDMHLIKKWPQAKLKLRLITVDQISMQLLSFDSWRTQDLSAAASHGVVDVMHQFYECRLHK